MQRARTQHPHLVNVMGRPALRVAPILSQACSPPASFTPTFPAWTCTRQETGPMDPGRPPAHELLERGEEQVVDGTEVLVALAQAELQEHQLPLPHVLWPLDNQGRLLRGDKSQSLSARSCTLPRCSHKPTSTAQQTLPPRDASWPGGLLSTAPRAQLSVTHIVPFHRLPTQWNTFTG